LRHASWATYVAWECEILGDASSVAGNIKRLLTTRAQAPSA
jgi:G:T-mismatch repair DNA endonuclease (very short patch repair protein)